MLKVVFLDIDGVLNSRESLRRRSKLSCKRIINIDEIDYPAEPMVSNLNKILKETNARIVVSSTWRLLHPVFDTATEKIKSLKSNSLESIFRNCGIQARIMDITPNIKFGGHRGLDIEAWLKDNKVERYVILDDTDEFFENQKPYFVQTTFEKGLTVELADKAIGILNS